MRRNPRIPVSTSAQLKIRIIKRRFNAQMCSGLIVPVLASLEPR